MNNVILSICIPTYNGGGSYLEDVLKNSVRILNCFENIEILVCDNCSNDNTSDIICKYKTIQPKLRTYRNSSNIGFNGNMKLLMDEYAHGEYLWMIGDDDIINVNALRFILNILLRQEIDYLSLKYRYIKTIEDLESLTNINKFTIYEDSFSKVIDINCRRGNSFGTFMGSAIVRRVIFNSVPKNIIENKFDSYYNVWPNAYINATAFFDKKCSYIPEPSIFCIEHHKDWTNGDNTFKICTQYNVQMYKYFLSLGMKEKDLKRTHIRVLYDYLSQSYLRLLKHKPIYKDFFNIWLSSLKYPIIRKTLYWNIAMIALSRINKKSYILKDVE